MAVLVVWAVFTQHSPAAGTPGSDGLCSHSKKLTPGEPRPGRSHPSLWWSGRSGSRPITGSRICTSAGFSLGQERLPHLRAALPTPAPLVAEAAWNLVFSGRMLAGREGACTGPLPVGDPAGVASVGPPRKPCLSYTEKKTSVFKNALQISSYEFFHPTTML